MGKGGFWGSSKSNYAYHLLPPALYGHLCVTFFRVSLVLEEINLYFNFFLG